jgi:hypothetical protein
VPKRAVIFHRRRRMNLALGAGAGRSAPIAACIAAFCILHAIALGVEAHVATGHKKERRCTESACLGRWTWTRDATGSDRLPDVVQTCLQTNGTHRGSRASGALDATCPHPANFCSCSCSCSTARSFCSALAPVKVKRAARHGLNANVGDAREPQLTWAGGGAGGRGEQGGCDVQREMAIGEMLDPPYRVSSHLFTSRRGQLDCPLRSHSHCPLPTSQMDSSAGRMLGDRGRMCEDAPKHPGPSARLRTRLDRVSSYMELVKQSSGLSLAAPHRRIQ